MRPRLLIAAAATALCVSMPAVLADEPTCVEPEQLVTVERGSTCITAPWPEAVRFPGQPFVVKDDPFLMAFAQAVGLPPDFFSRPELFTAPNLGRLWGGIKSFPPILLALFGTDDVDAIVRQVEKDRLLGNLENGGRPINDPLVTSIDAVPTPAGFDEPIHAFASRTTVVEFARPRSDYDVCRLGPGGTTKIRGWYIRGRAQGSEDAPRPLFLMLQPIGANPFSPAPQIAHVDGVADVDFSAALRQVAFRAATDGFDVLLYSFRGQGVSEGMTAHEGRPLAEDVFGALDAMERGTVATRPAGAHPWPATPARGRPVVLWGFSQGANVAQKVMTLNFADSYEGEPNVPRGYDIRGAILIAASLCGSPYYFAGPTSIVGDAILRFEGPPGVTGAPCAWNANLFSIVDASALAGARDWPGACIMQATRESEAVKGGVELYNTILGWKEIHTIVGIHGDHCLPEQLPVTIARSLDFARRVVAASPPMDDDRRTSVEEQVTGALEHVHGE